MDQNIVDRRLVLGGKALVQTTPQATTEQPLASASTTTMFANVRDFGAKGNGRTDDTVAIRAAVNWGSRLNRGDIYFPVGQYRITAPIIFGRHRNVSINFIGAPGAMIFGNFRGYLLHGLTIDGRSGTHSVENLTISNVHLRGGGVAFRDCAGGRVSNCFVSAWQGILADRSLSLLVDACTVLAPPEVSRSSVGISGRGNTSVTCTTVARYHVGLQHYFAGLTVLGGQFKDNTYGLALIRSEGFHIAGPSMRQNRVGIYVRDGVGGTISGVSIDGRFAMTHGLRLDSCEAVTVQAVTVQGNRYSGAGIAIENSRRIVAVGVTSASSRTWAVSGPRQHLNFIQTNYQ